MNIKFFRKEKVSFLSTHREGNTLYKDYYWVTIDGDPVFYSYQGIEHPQCNRSKELSSRYVEILKQNGLAAGCVFVPLAYVLEQQKGEE